MDDSAAKRARGDQASQPPEEERTSLHPLSFEDAVEGLLRTDPPSDAAATLDALTFADPTVKEAMNGGGRFISHEELMKRLERD